MADRVQCSADPTCELPDGHPGLCRCHAFGEAEGFKGFKVIGPPAKPRLYSQYGWNSDPAKHFSKASIWPPNDWMTARCPSAPSDPAEALAYYAHHRTPALEEHCGCGIYAAASREHLHTLSAGYYSYSRDELVVCGRIALAGKVVVCETGFRAAKARVLELFVPAERWDYAVGLGDAYGCPVVLDNTWAEVVSDHASRIGG